MKNTDTGQKSLGGLKQQERFETCREKRGVKEGRISTSEHRGVRLMTTAAPTPQDKFLINSKHCWNLKDYLSLLCQSLHAIDSLGVKLFTKVDSVCVCLCLCVTKKKWLKLILNLHDLIFRNEQNMGHHVTKFGRPKSGKPSCNSTCDSSLTIFKTWSSWVNSFLTKKL